MAAKAFVGMTETKFYSEAGVLLSNPGNGPSAVTGTAYLLSPRLLESGDDCRAWHKRHLFHLLGRSQLTSVLWSAAHLPAGPRRKVHCRPQGPSRRNRLSTWPNSC